MDPITVNVKVKSITTKAKQVKMMDDSYETIKLGIITLEFDADGVETVRIKDMIGDEPILLGLTGAQHAFAGPFAETQA